MHDDEPVEVNHHVQHRHPHDIRFCALCGAEMRVRPVAPDGRRHKVCSACGFVDFQGPKVVAGCLVVKEKKLLLLRRGISPARGKWTFPGGYVDEGETPLQAALRETEEEVGMRVRVGDLFGLYADPDDPVAAVAVYSAQPGNETPSLSDEAIEVRYFGADEIPWDEVAFRTTRDALNDWVTRVGGK
ncbi:MAG TPA: NUDIX hydrolase [Candidatus Binataceae bacterium]|nr:NUDIX hydrolase [Candidatus Binataceae bacterium]